MKVNKKVSELARKLEYIKIDSEDRRGILKKCITPLCFLLGGYYTIRIINKTYETHKKLYEDINKLNTETPILLKIRRKYLTQFN